MNLPRIIIDAALFCPHCGARHVDEARNGEKWHRRAHTTHRCQACGGDFDVYVSGQAPPSPTDLVEMINEGLGRAGIRGAKLVGDGVLEFPLATLGSKLRKVRIKVEEVSE